MDRVARLLPMGVPQRLTPADVQGASAAEAGAQGTITADSLTVLLTQAIRAADDVRCTPLACISCLARAGRQRIVRSSGGDMCMPAGADRQGAELREGCGAEAHGRAARRRGRAAAVYGSGGEAAGHPGARRVTATVAACSPHAACERAGRSTIVARGDVATVAACRATHCAAGADVGAAGAAGRARGCRTAPGGGGCTRRDCTALPACGAPPPKVLHVGPGARDNPLTR